MSRNAKTESKPASSPAPKVTLARLGRWGGPRFPRGIENVHRAWAQVHHEIGHYRAGEWVKRVLSELPRYVGTDGNPKTDDDYVWDRAYYYTLSCGAQVAVLIPHPSGVVMRHIAVYVRGVGAVAVDRELAELVREIFHAIED